MATRRSFVLRAAATAGAILLLPLRTAWARARKLAFGLDKVDKLQQVGGSVVLKIHDRPVLFVRDGDTSVRALSAVCTHRHCTVSWDSDKGEVACGCHGSTFGIDGSVLTGPARDPLPVYPSELRDGRVIVTLPDDEADK